MRGKTTLNVTAALLALAISAAWSGAALAGQDFRREHDLASHQPPDWFLAGHFVACEVGPRYVFGTVGDFVQSLGCPSVWLIEPEEQARVSKAAQAGQLPEYSLYLEQDAPEGKVYWMFVVLPHQDPQQWFRERHDYHKSKADGYYGQTLEGMKKAHAQGLSIQGELRFRVVGGQPTLETPESALLAQGKLSPAFDLQEGRAMPGKQSK